MCFLSHQTESKSNFFIFIVSKLFRYHTLSPFFTVLVVNLLMAFLAASPRRRYGNYKGKQTLMQDLWMMSFILKSFKCIKFLLSHNIPQVTSWERIVTAIKKLEKLAAFP